MVENVSEVGIIGPLTGLLSRLEGYSQLSHGMMDPRSSAGVPVARTRHFWVLERADTLSDSV